MSGKKIKLAHHHRAWRYNNLMLTAVGILVSLVLSQSQVFQQTILHLGSLGFVGAFLAGALFVTTFTVATGAVMLSIFAQQYNPVVLGLIAGAGALVSDIVIFRFVKDSLASELAPLYNHFSGRRLTHLLHTKYFRWTLPVVGAVIMASPLPEELGISLMGLSKMSTAKFLVVSYLLNSAGIFLVTTSASILSS